MAILASTEIEASAWKKLAIFWAALSVLFFVLISLFLGSTFDPTSFQSSISINVVNFDRQSPLGESFRTVTRSFIQGNRNGGLQDSPLVPNNALGARGSLAAGWSLPDSDTFVDVEEVIETVRSGRKWGAIIVNPGADAALRAAAASGDVNYDPRSAITIIYDEGRNPATYVFLVNLSLASVTLQSFQCAH
jgi:hypothetical protein